MASVTRTIAASAAAVWNVLADPATWPTWGPVMADIEFPSRTIRPGMRGSALYIPGIWVPYIITDVNGRRRSWSWRVGHLPEVHHGVVDHPALAGHSVVSFEAPAWYPGHLIVSRLALHHLDAAVTGPAN